MKLLLLLTQLILKKLDVHSLITDPGECFGEAIALRWTHQLWEVVESLDPVVCCLGPHHTWRLHRQLRRTGRCLLFVLTLALLLSSALVAVNDLCLFNDGCCFCLGCFLAHGQQVCCIEMQTLLSPWTHIHIFCTSCSTSCVLETHLLKALG